MELFRFMDNAIKQNISPDKIWDLKYNKRNKLLTYCNYSQCEYPKINYREKWWKHFNNTTKYSNKLFYKNPNLLDFKGAIYLFILILFYCCVLIKATKITNTDNYFKNNSKFLNNNRNDKQSLSSAINATIEEFNAMISNQSDEENFTQNQFEAMQAYNNNGIFNENDYFNNLNMNNELNEKRKMNEMDFINNASTTNISPNPTPPQHPPALKRSRIRVVRGASSVPDDDDYDSGEDLDEYEILINNKSAKGKYIGAPCDENKCEATLLHVSCDTDTSTCSCDKNYPVIIGLTRGCDKPKKLGEQCFYHQTCTFSDENSLCVQVKHNARCQCASGFHSVSYSKPTKRIFCTQDIAKMASDLPTLLGVTTGIAVLAGLICMVLHLFSKTKYPRHRNFGDANLPPPIMYSSDTGIPLTVQSGRPSSRSSIRSSGSIGSYGNRRSSSTLQSGSGSKGILVSTSRTGSRRPSLASVHSTSSSVRSYSMMRFEKEVQQKEIRCEMKQRLARLQQQQHMSQNKPQIIIGDALCHGAIAKVIAATPSPLTPNSTDELLPSVDETQEFPLKIDESSFFGGGGIGIGIGAAGAYHGPCSSSTEGL